MTSQRRFTQRENWAKDSQRIAQADEDKPVWPEFGNEGDAELVW